MELEIKKEKEFMQTIGRFLKVVILYFNTRINYLHDILKLSMI